MAVHRNQVAALLGGLSPLQEKIVRLYFGIGCERSHSASEIAREFQVSSQVIGGILAGAQRRLAKVGLTPCNQKVCGGTRRLHSSPTTSLTAYTCSRSLVMSV